MMKRTLSMLAACFCAIAAFAELPEADFIYRATSGSAPSGWLTSWTGKSFSDSEMAIGPGDFGNVYRVTADGCPYNSSAPAKGTTTSYKTLAIYADISRMVSDRGVILALGGCGTGTASKGKAVIRDGDTVKVVYTAKQKLSETYDGVNVAGLTGYHLITIAFDTRTTKNLILSIDDGKDGKSITISSANAFALPSAGMSIGSIYGADSLDGALHVGTGMAVAAVLGYDVKLTEDQIAELSALYPPTNAFTGDTVYAVADGSLVAGSMTNATGSVKVEKGELLVPAGAAFSAAGVELGVEGSAETAALTLAGGSLRAHSVVCSGPSSFSADGGAKIVLDEYTPGFDAIVRSFGAVTVEYLSSTEDLAPAELVDTEEGTVFHADGVTVVYGGAIGGAGLAVVDTVNDGVVAFTALGNTGGRRVRRGTAQLPAGAEGSVVVDTGATLKLALSAEQCIAGYTASGVTLPTGDHVVFVRPSGVETPGAGEGGLTYIPSGIGATNVWTGAAGDGRWRNGGNWSLGWSPESYEVVRLPIATSITLDGAGAAARLIVEADVTLNETAEASLWLGDEALELASGSTFDWNFTEEIVVPGVKGDGTIVKRGTGTLVLGNTADGAVFRNGVLDIRGGAVTLRDLGAGEPLLDTMTVRLSSPGTLAADGSGVRVRGTLVLENDDEATILSPVAGSCLRDAPGGVATIVKRGTGTLKVLGRLGAAADDTIGGALVIEAGRLEFACPVEGLSSYVGSTLEGAGTLAVAAGARVVMTPVDVQAFTGKLAGAGVFAFKALPSFAGFDDEAEWTGTVELLAADGAYDRPTFDLSAIGNPSSTIRFNGVRGDFGVGAANRVGNFELGEGGLALVGSHASALVDFCGRLSGSGTLKMEQAGEGSTLRFVGGGAGFGGSVEFSAGCGWRLVLAASESLALPAFAARQVVILGTRLDVVAGASVGDSGGFYLGDGAELAVAGSIGGALAGSGSVLLDWPDSAVHPLELAGFTGSLSLSGDASVAIGGAPSAPSGTGVIYVSGEVTVGEGHAWSAQRTVLESSAVFDCQGTLAGAFTVKSGATLRGPVTGVSSAMVSGTVYGEDRVASGEALITTTGALPTVAVGAKCVIGGTEYNLTALGASVMVVSEGVTITVAPGRNFTNASAGVYVDFGAGSAGSGTYVITVRDADGNVVAQKNGSFTGSSASINESFADLVAGGTYYFDAVVTSGSVTYSKTEVAVIAARESLEEWPSGRWIRETSRTFRVGGETGEWIETVPDLVRASTGRIGIDTTDGAAGLRGSVVFLPTNATATATGYEVRHRVRFASAKSPTSFSGGVFGYTLGFKGTSAAYAFWVIGNGAWRQIDTAVFSPKPGVDYDVVCIVDEQHGEVSYSAGEVGGTMTCLGRYPIVGKTRFGMVEFSGRGSTSSLDGYLDDSRLLRLDTGVTLAAGLNFEEAAVTGTVRFVELQENDLGGGKVRVTVRDNAGNVVAQQTYDYSAVTDEIAINLPVAGGVVPGMTYTTDVEVLIGGAAAPGVVDDGAATDVSMDRVSAPAWIDENAATFAGTVSGTGEWRNRNGASVSGGAIVFTTAGGELVFVPTNSCAEFASYSVGARIAFGAEGGVMTVGDGRFGVRFTAAGGGLVLAVGDNGTWTEIPVSVFLPQIGAWVDVEAVFNPAFGQVTYYAAGYDGVKIRLAVVDADGDISSPGQLVFSGAGRIAAVRGEGRDTSLLSAELMLDEWSLTPGTNFTNTVIHGFVDVNELHENTIAQGLIRFTVYDADGNVAGTFTRRYAGSGMYEVDWVFDGLVGGAGYVVKAEVIPDDESRRDRVSGDANGTVDVKMARKVKGLWIDEDADTFEGLREASGEWRKPSSSVAEAVDVGIGRGIFISSELDAPVQFTPIDRSDEVVRSTLREVRFALDNVQASYRLSEPVLPPMESDDIVGLAVACDDLGAEPVCRFAVWDPAASSWRVSDRRTVTLGADCRLVVVIDYRNGVVSYYEETEGGRELIDTVRPAWMPTVGAGYTSVMRFPGSGTVGYLEGDCFDSHLAEVDGTEYWSIDEAVAAVENTDRALTPLWYSTYHVTGDSGRIGVFDPNGYLRFLWDLGYVFRTERDGETVFYVFYISDNWLDFADASGVEINGSDITVLNEQGLAWIAREATNAWVRGTITLAADLPRMADHDWTPIYGFSGTFDGNGHVITGLRNGDYDGGPTNDLGLSAYALFAAASNSVFRNVRFETVAITNSADAVATLLGCGIGTLSVSDVQVASGAVNGAGRYVAAVVGLAADYPILVIAGNRNAAEVSMRNTTSPAVYAAGIANFAGFTAGTGSPATVSVTDNENSGPLASVIRSTEEGGNVAQIAGGTVRDAVYATVDVSGNVATGDVSAVTSLRHEGWPLAALPVVNLSSAVSSQRDADGYSEYLEANDAVRALVDPVRHTALVSHAFYQDGVPNPAGELADTIAASEPGTTVTLGDSIETHSPIVVDRDITIDLNSKVIDCVFDDYAISIPDAGVMATVKNGTIVAKTGRFVDQESRWTTANVNLVPWDVENYWERTLWVDGEFADSLVSALHMLRSASSVRVPADSVLSVDPDTRSLLLEGAPVKTFSADYRMTAVRGEDGVIVYEIDLVDAAKPTLDLARVGDGVALVRVLGAKAGYEYALQSVSELGEAWGKATDEWVSVGKDGDKLEFLVPDVGASAFYRLSIREK